MNFGTMLGKELKELARSYKLLFVPVVFAVLGLGQPLAIKLLPQLMQSASNLPPGAVIQIPTPPPDQVVAGVIGQVNQMGILLLVLVAMGSIAGERLSGVAATVLTKPVGRGEYLGAKAVAYSLLAVVSVVAGLGVGAYYTGVFIGPVDWGHVTLATLLYLPNLLLAVALTLCFSAFLPSPLAAGGAGLAAVVLLNIAPRYMGKSLFSVSPGALTESAVNVLVTGSGVAIRPVLGVGMVAAAVLVAGWYALERQEI